MSDHHLRDTVREKYAAMARAGSSCCGPASKGCCAPAADPDALATAIGYDADELVRLLPEGVNLGLSCGNPGVIAALAPGEVVVDLGSGAGFDAFLCGPGVGAAGRVIGVDMTSDMLTKARASVAGYIQRSGLNNVEFRLGEIEHLPVADASVDVVISNCVVNLSTDKPQVWREIFRVLKPGGRVAISDIVLLQALPAGLKNLMEAYVGCISGASSLDDLRQMMTSAGFVDLDLTPKSAYVDTLSDGDDPFYREIRRRLPGAAHPNEYFTSMDIAAIKPANAHD